MNEMPEGASRAFAANGIYFGAENPVMYDITRSVTWNSSDPQLVSIGDSGRVTARSPGTVDLTITWPRHGLTDSVQVKVVQMSPSGIEIDSPSMGGLPLGTTRSFTAMGLYGGGGAFDITGAVEWHSTQPEIAAFTEAGVLLGLEDGETTVWATRGESESNAIDVEVLASAVHVCREMHLWFKKGFQGDLLDYGRAFKFSRVEDMEVQGVIEDPDDPAAYDFRVVMWWEYLTHPCLHIGEGATAYNMGNGLSFDELAVAPAGGDYRSNAFEESNPVYGLNPDYQIDPITDRETNGDFFTGMPIGDSFDEGGLPWPVGRFMTDNVYIIRTAEGHYAKLQVVEAAAGEFILRYAYQKVPENHDLDTGGD
jgi:hypothetical protein